MPFSPVIVPPGGPVKGGEMSMMPRTVSLLLCVVAVAATALLIALLGDRVMSQTHSLHPHADVLKTEDGQWKYTNALADETSPYLLQHAHNPVDWHAWGPAAFEAARAAGKPIFLSIGYSTCYWCHVMERQCFENPRIAAQMNEQFICIKVDREERPDIDDIYMAATVMITRGRGGWPMSLFLTPPGTKGPDDRGLKPFFAGTYFPPEPRHGSPGFPQLMNHLTQLWETRRNDLAASADQIAEHLVAYLGRRDADGDLERRSIQTAADQLTGSYDPVHGGFGSAPKFPTPNNLQFLLRVYGDTGSAELGNALRHTLDRMARGGMYDQVGGGFHRYSVDERWLVPHFEKMLYDNGQLVEVYLDADARLPDKDDPQARRRVVREICDYVLREMTDPTGTFWSAEDAEVDAREGGSYLWIPDEVNAALDDAELAAQALVMYGLDQGTNFTDPHAPDAPPANVLHLPARLDDLASRWNLSVNDVAELRQRINTRLYAARSQRKQPSTDDKVLTAWNGIMVAALATAGRVLEETRYINAAADAARYILGNMRSSDGGLYRSMRGGKVKIEGFLEDYAYFVHALVALYHADHDGPWLAAAIELTDEARRRFGAEGGGYYDTLADQPDLIVRTRGISDTAIPSGNSQMIHNLVDLFEATGQEGYLAMARQDLQSFAGSLANQGAGMAHMQHALLRVLGGGPDGGMAARMPGPGTFSREPRLGIEVEPAHLDLSGGTGRARVTISIPQTYHLNAHDPGLEGLIGMRFEIRPADGLTLSVHYPMGQSTHFAYSDIPINVYAGTIDVELDFAADGGAEEGFSPRLFLKYQLCGEHACLAPAETPVPLRLTYDAPP